MLEDKAEQLGIRFLEVSQGHLLLLLALLGLVSLLEGVLRVQRVALGLLVVLLGSLNAVFEVLKHHDF